MLGSCEIFQITVFLMPPRLISKGPTRSSFEFKCGGSAASPTPLRTTSGAPMNSLLEHGVHWFVTYASNRIRHVSGSGFLCRARAICSSRSSFDFAARRAATGKRDRSLNLRTTCIHQSRTEPLRGLDRLSYDITGPMHSSQLE